MLKKRYKIDGLFMLTYEVYLIFALLSTTFYYKYYAGVLYRGIKLICFILLFVHESRKLRIRLNVFFGLLICGMIYLNFSYNAGIFSDIGLMVILLYCGRDIPFKKIAEVTIKISIVVIFFVIISSYLGIIENYVQVAGVRRREYLGFTYSLYPAAIMFNITALTLYVRNRFVNLIEIFLLFLGNFWIFQKTTSRLSFYMAVFMILCSLLYKYFPRILTDLKIVHVGMVVSYIGSAIFSFWITETYNPSVEWMNQLNDILGARLLYGKRSLDIYGVSLLGNKNIKWVGNGLNELGEKPKEEYLWVDNFYISIAQRYGMLVLILIILLITIALIIALRKKNYYLMFFLSMIAGHCVIDDLFIYIYYNTFWFALPMLFLKKDEKDENYKMCPKNLKRKKLKIYL